MTVLEFRSYKAERGKPKAEKVQTTANTSSAFRFPLSTFG